LQELRKQKAFFGAKADPSISMEIDDIEVKIAELQKELGEEVSQPKYSPPVGKSPKYEFTLPKRRLSLRDFRRRLQGE
jgi:hypothetical protein